MKSSFFKDMLMPPIVLTLICAVVTFALAQTYIITKPIIDESKRLAAENARKELLATATGFEEVALTAEQAAAGVVDIYRATNGVGYVVTTTEKGYGGPLKVMVGFDGAAQITGVAVIEHNETAGLGSKCADPVYTSQYIGKDAALEGIDFISGSTVTSKAVNKAVAKAFGAYGESAGLDLDVNAGPVREPVDDEIKTSLFPNVTEFTRMDVPGEAYKAGEEGYIVIVAEDGFIDYIVTAVAFDNDGKIIDILMLQNNETEGYGERLSKVSYLDKLLGITSAEEVQLVSGATISSEAFKKSIADAFEAYALAQALPVNEEAPVQAEGSTAASASTEIGEVPDEE